MNEEISYVGDAGGDPYLDVNFYTKLIDGEEHDFIKINVPGDKSFNIDTGADDEYKARFRRQWEAYKGLKNIVGTPLDEWDELNESLANELKYQGFRYIEQIASAPDSAFSRIMGGQQLREKAKTFINRGKVNSETIIAKQAEQIAQLQEQMALLMETKATTVKATTVKEPVPTKATK
jgi:hypothetical protein